MAISRQLFTPKEFGIFYKKVSLGNSWNFVKYKIFPYIKLFLNSKYSQINNPTVHLIIFYKNFHSMLRLDATPQKRCLGFDFKFKKKKKIAYTV